MTTTVDFMVLKVGASDPSGPFSESQLLDLLREGEITTQDYVYYEGMRDWRPISEVFDVEEEISHVVDDGQDQEKLNQAFELVSQRIKDDEEIYYIAIQAKVGILTKTRQCVVITNENLFHLTEGGSGFTSDSHPWATVSHWEVGEDDGKGMGMFSFEVNDARRVHLPSIPTSQLQRLSELCSEMKA